MSNDLDFDIGLFSTHDQMISELVETLKKESTNTSNVYSELERIYRTNNFNAQTFNMCRDICKHYDFWNPEHPVHQQWVSEGGTFDSQYHPERYAYTIALEVLTIVFCTLDVPQVSTTTPLIGELIQVTSSI